MSRNLTIRLIAVLALTITACVDDAGPLAPLLSEPPFESTIFIHPDIITQSDPTTYVGLDPAGQGSRTMFDRRLDDGWVTLVAFLFDARFADGLTIEIQVNPEFRSSAIAEVQARKYAEVIGRLPTALRLFVKTVWIHRGVRELGGGNNNLLIHTDQADLYMADGILEETLVHEGAHTSLDAAHQSSPGWRAAQAADGTYISDYARNHSVREDIAESFLPYLAIRFRSDRISASLRNQISQTMPNRIDYFDGLGLDMHPIQ